MQRGSSFDDAVETGEAVVDAAGEIVDEAVDWTKDTYKRVKNADNPSEFAGMAAAAAIQALNPAGKAGKVIKAVEKIEKKLHKPKRKSGKKGDDGGAAEDERKKKCGGKTASKNKGDCAERLVNEKYENEGHDIFDTSKITNGSGHGLDHVTSIGDTVFITETKANNSPMSKLQDKGGKFYHNKQNEAYERGLDGEGRMGKVPNEGIEDYLDYTRDKNIQYRKCRVQLHHDSSGCYGRLGKGKCRAKSINCEPWQAKK